MRAAALGALRVALVVALLVAATPVFLISLAVPARGGGVRPTLRLGQAVCRAVLAVCGVRRTVHDAARLRAHRGMILFNHPSFLDPLVVMAAAPVRFLGAAGVRRIPFVGAMARAAGTLFVDRGDAASRAHARRALRAALRGRTPVALAPEGGIQHTPGVGALRHGAFEVAGDAGAEILLVALDYTDRARLRWEPGETLFAPLWRVCARTTPFTARLRVAGPALDPSALPVTGLAALARRRLDAALGAPPMADAPRAVEHAPLA